MSNISKWEIVIIFFLVIYLPAVFSRFFGSISFLYESILIICSIYIIFRIYRSNSLSMEIIFKVILFILFMYVIIAFDRLFMTIFLCGMDGVGFLQRSGIVEYHHSCADFSPAESLYFDFLSTLYYPIYIFLFIIPFAKHLDKSIKKNKDQQEQKESK